MITQLFQFAKDHGGKTGIAVNASALLAVLLWARPLIVDAMEVQQVFEETAQTAQENKDVLGEVVVQNTEQGKDIEHIKAQLERTNDLLERILLQERNQ